MAGQQCFTWYLGKCKGCAVTLSHNRPISHPSWQKELRQHRYYILKIRQNGMSTTFGLTAWKNEVLGSDIKS